MAAVVPESGAIAVATLVVQGSLEITLKKPAADAKVGVSLVGSPPLVHQIRAGGLGAAAGLRLRDRVVSVNGLPVSGQEDAAAALAAAPAGALVVVVERPAPPPPDAHMTPMPVPVVTTQPGVVQVLVPPGPIGIQFRGTTVEKVLPSSPLRGHVWPNYALKTVNGMEATAESLLAERGVLEINDDGSTPRTLVFRAPTPAEIQAKVHDIVRKGGTLHSNDALAYSRSLTPEQASILHLEGCHHCVAVTPCGAVPGPVCTYNFACSDTCLCFPCCFLGMCLPVYSCLCCTCERAESGAWITRGEGGVKMGEIIVVDYEQGTLAHYGAKCCSDDLEDDPGCYCKRLSLI